MFARPAFGRFSEETLSSHDQVARALGHEILSGAFPPGTKLPSEDALLARFGISRTVLREVFKTLSAKGLIISRTRVGTTVLDSAHWNFFDADVLSWKVSGNGFDPDFLQDLAEIRRALEPAAAELAARRRTKQDVTEMRRCLERMAAATDNAREFAEADLEFHKAIGRASGNALMRSLAAVIETALLASFQLSSPVHEPDVHSTSVVGHRSIVDAIEARDGAGAAQAMRAIISHGLQRITRVTRAKKLKA